MSGRYRLLTRERPSVELAVFKAKHKCKKVADRRACPLCTPELRTQRVPFADTEENWQLRVRFALIKIELGDDLNEIDRMALRRTGHPVPDEHIQLELGQVVG